MGFASILFLGSGRFGLPALERLAAGPAGQVGVATVPSAPRGRHEGPIATPVKDCAARLGLPCLEVATLAKPHGAELLARTGARLVISADIRLYLTGAFLGGVPLGCWNLHPSLLPRWRGAAPVARSVLAGERRFGVTLYRMVKEMDAGPIVGQREYAPGKKMDTPALEAVLSRLAAELLEEWLPALLGGSAPEADQDAARATLAPRLAKDEGWIDWSWSAERLENHVLAMKPWPRSFARLRAEAEERPVLLFVDELVPIPGMYEPASAGTIRAASAEGIDVACGAGGRETVRLLALQRAGKRVLPVAEFLRGCRVRTGDLLAGATAIRP